MKLLPNRARPPSRKPTWSFVSLPMRGAEVGAVLVGHERDDAARHRDAGRALPPGLRPGVPVELDLLGLQLVEGDARVLGEQRRAHQVHALLGRPSGGRARAAAPPDAICEARRLRLDRQVAVAPVIWGWRGPPLARDRGPEQLGLGAREVGVGLALRRYEAERVRPVERRLG